MNILLVGAYPPPVGGISVHIQRLMKLLSDTGCKAKVVDYSGNPKNDNPRNDDVIVLPRALLQKTLSLIHTARQTTADTVVHFHVAAIGRFKWVAPLFMMLFWSQPKIITIHGGGFITETNRRAARFYFRWMLRRFSHIITVNAEQAEHVTTLGIPFKKLSVIPAFLPQQADRNLLPRQVAVGAEGKIVVLTSGYLDSTYNYEVLIDCIPQLEADRYCFLFAFYSESDPRYEEHIFERLTGLNNVIVTRDQPPEVFMSVVDRCDIYVRTTVMDGNAVAIHEALQLGKTVFATNCVERPEACRLFSQSDPDSLLILFRAYHVNSQPVDPSAANPNAERIMKIYQCAHSTIKRT